MRRVFIRSQCFSSKMSDLPPRKAPSNSKASKQDVSPLQILLQMGFPRHRALKALAATGNRSVQLASDWLLTHVNDTFIDTDAPREYILYACPTGPLSTQLHEFWEKSKSIAGWNGAHNSPPHITLVSFFKAPDESSLQLAKAIKHVVESIGEPPTTPMKLEPYISQNFMGLFVSEAHADYLKKIAVHYVKEVSSALGVSMDTYEHLDALGTCFPWCTMSQEKPIKPVCLEPHVKALHLTLAYHFAAAAFEPLKQLVHALAPLDSGWELRLYSRDPRFHKHQVHEVRQSYAPKESDELELVLGDYVYIEEKEVAASADGWVTGTSWLTGVTGCLPAVYTHRTNESDAWTLHRAVALGNTSNCDAKSESDSNTEAEMNSNYSQDDSEKLGREKSEESYQEWGKYWKVVQTTKSASILDVTQGTTSNWSEQNGAEAGDAAAASGSATDDTAKNGDSSRRWLFAMRHGERVDLTYGVWVPHCFDESGNYTRRDLNMPITLASRSGGQHAYERDTPLTRVGALQARLVGEALRLARVPVAHVYASCALRCVETAHAFLEGLQAGPNVKIRVEPGLFEYKGWHLTKGMVPFMTPQELHKAGFNVDLDYTPYEEIDLVSPETLDECYRRGERVMHAATADTEKQGGNIIFVGHAATLDIMVTAMRRYSAAAPAGERAPYQVSEHLLRVPYCALAAMRTAPCELVKPPCPPSINSSSGRFDWKILLDVGL